ncbi:hypothetical protein ACVOMV_36470 [Mesorhizobium atlanticum]
MVGKLIVGLVLLMFLIAFAVTAYSLIFGCPHGGSYHCEQRNQREVCGCPDAL